ncbi:MAG: hypothetical protein MZV63_63395 [Marinilabiliales bacterium]|nr:hypothetical protein [Marinilabiliales bacterium]
MIVYCRRRLRGNPAVGREGSRCCGMGWRKQRLAVLQARSLDRGRRPPSAEGHELTCHPGETNLRGADCVVINKIDTADYHNVEEVRENAMKANPKATIIEAASPIQVDDPSVIRGKRVLVVEDGPTLTHGEMSYGAGTVAAMKFGAEDHCRSSSILHRHHCRDAPSTYPEIGVLLPAMGYSDQQIKDLENTIMPSATATR